MNHQEQLKYNQSTEEYLEKTRVYDLLNDLMEKLIISQPVDPLQFLIEEMQSKPVGPPGCNVKFQAKQLADKLQYNLISMETLLQKEIDNKTAVGSKIQEEQKKGILVNDEITLSILEKELTEIAKNKKSFILEGVPKTRAQCMFLQRHGIIPNCFILFNEENQNLFAMLNIISYIILQSERFENQKLFADASEQDRENLVKNYITEYLMNIQQVKEMYKNYHYEINLNSSDINLQIERYLSYKILNQIPKKSQQIIMIGVPGKKTSTSQKAIAYALSDKYGWTLISMEEIFKDQIAKKTEVGAKLVEHLKNKTDVPEDLILGLLNSRLQKTDCKLQGFILEGFPKTVEQVSKFKDLKIKPSLIIQLEAKDISYSQEKLTKRKIDPLTKEIYTAQEIMSLKNENILERLEQFADERPEYIKKWFNNWHEVSQQFQKQPELTIKVDANLSQLQILESISFHIENYCQK